MQRKMVATYALILAVVVCSCQSGVMGTGTTSPNSTADRASSATGGQGRTETPLAGTPTPAPTVAPTKPKTSVILVALDGARPDWISGYIENGTMPNLAALAQRGVMAVEGLQAVEPVLTIPSYLALSTGDFPNHTGLTFTGPESWSGALLPSTISEYGRIAPNTNLSEGSHTAAEPFWRTAMRNGLRTATVFWPAASLDDLDMRADYMVAIAESDIPSAQHTVALREASGWESTPASFSALLEGTLRITSREGSTATTLHLLALDEQDDAATAYDLLLLDDDKDLANGYTELRLGKWAGISISPRLHSGARFCFTASTGLTVTLYQSRVAYNQAQPAELLQAVNAQFGFPPAAPDSAALRAGWLTPQQYSEMAQRRAEWMGYMGLYVYETYAPDLLLMAQTTIADYARPFLLVDGRQEGYGPEKAEQYASFLSKAHATVDENLGHLLEQVNLADSAVFVVSPHGLLPVHTEVRVNTILSNAKLLQLKTGVEPRQVDTGKSKAWAAAAGGNAHIYINLQGREWPGVVAPEDYAKVQEQIITALQETKDETGQPVFARILRGEELDALHMQSPNAGDVFAQAAPGYYLSAELGAKAVLAAAPCSAAEGFEATLPEMHGVFIAAGDGLVSRQAIPPVSVLDIAPTIAQALHFSPAATVQGHPIAGIWR